MHPQNKESRKTIFEDLLAAVKSNDKESVKAFIEAGADVETRDAVGHTLLYFACNANHPVIARLLIDAGADISAADRSGITPLHCACVTNPDLALFLIEKGADPWVRDENDITPLHLACTKGYVNVVRSILKCNTGTNVAIETGLTPLDCAVRYLKPDNPAREEIIDLFREHAPDLVMEAYCISRFHQGPGNP